MARLPDIPVQSWIEDQTTRFQQATGGYFDALEFEDGAKQAETTIPPDYPLPGGPDQWNEAEQKNREEELRREQDAADQAQQQWQAQRVQELEAQQQQAAQAQQQQAQDRNSSVMAQIRSLGIPTPDQIFGNLSATAEQQPDHTSTSGLLDSLPADTREADLGPHEQSPEQPSEELLPGRPIPEQNIVPLGPALRGATYQSQDDQFINDDAPYLGTNRNMPVVGEPIQEGPERALPTRNVPIQGGRPIETDDIGMQTRPLSDTEAFSNWAQQMNEPVFGPEQPDHTSSTGLLDSIREAAAGVPAALHLPEAGQNIAEVAGNIGRAAEEAGKQPVGLGYTVGDVAGFPDYLIQNYGAGKVARNLDRINELRDEQAQFTGSNDPLQRVGSDINPVWEQAHPEKADELRKLQNEQVLAVGGMAGAGIPGGAGEGIKGLLGINKGLGVVGDAIDAIKAMRAANLGDDLVLLAEQKLAQGTTMTLDEIQALTRGTIRAAAQAGTEAAAPESRASTYIDSETGRPVLDPTAERGLPVSAVPEAQASAAERERITGVGAVPEGASQEGISAAQQERRFFEEEQQPLTRADLDREIDEALKRPGYAQQVREAAQHIDPNAVGTQQGVLARSALEAADAYGEAAARFRTAVRAQREDPADEHLLLASANAAREAAERFQEMQLGVRGSSLSARAASRALSALRGPYEAAQALVGADRMRETAEVIGRAAKRVGQAIKTGVVDEDTLRELEQVQRRLTNPRTRKLLTDGETEDRIRKLAADRRQGRGVPTGEQEESLAERLGRLKREQGRLTETGSPADKANIADDITDVITQIREAAQQHAAAIVAKTRQPLTPAQAEAAVNRAVGQPVVSKMEREALAEAKGFKQAKFSENLTKSVEDAISRRINDERRLQESIETQMNRRLQKALDQEKRGKTREEVRTMANEARQWIQRIRQMPNQPDLREELDVRLGKMAEHSNTGENVANELRQQLESHLGEDAFRFMSDVERRNADSARRFMLGARSRNAEATIAEGQRAAREAEKARLDSLVERIDNLRKLPHAPGAAERLQELYADMTAVSQKGFERSSRIRQRLYDMSLTKAGLDVKGANADQMRQLLAGVDPNDPATLRPVMELLGKPSLWKLAREISYVNLLSRPTTNITNATSSALNIVGRLLLQNPLEFLASRGYNTGVRAGFQGAAAGIRKGAELWGDTMRTGVNPRRVESQLVHGSLGRIEQELIPQYLRRIFGTGAWDAAGKLGVAMHLVSTRPLEATDAMLGHIAYSSGIYQQARRKADMLIRSGEDVSGMLLPGSKASTVDQVTQHIMANIWDHEDVLARAGKIMDYSLFRGTGNSRLEQALRNVMAAKEPGKDAGLGEHVAGALLDMLIPFWNVPVNTAKQGIDLTTGVVPLVRAVSAAAHGDRERFGEQMAKAMIGAGTTAGLVALAAGDNLTDLGPQDPGQRRVWLEDHKPNSWRIPGVTPPGVWFTWEGTPWAVPAGAAASAVRKFKETGKTAEAVPQSDLSRAASVGLATGGGAVHGVFSNTLLQNLMESYQLLSGEGATSLSGYSQFGASTAARYTPSPIPTGLLSFLASVTDSVERDAGRPQTGDEFGGNVVDRIKMGIPGLRQQVPARIGAYGEEVPNTRAGGYSMVPLWRGQAQYEGDPVTKNLEDLGIGAPIAPREISLEGLTVPISMGEQRQYQQLYGQRFRDMLDRFEERRPDRPQGYSAANYEAARTAARNYAENTMWRSIPEEERHARVRLAQAQLVRERAQRR